MTQPGETVTELRIDQPHTALSLDVVNFTEVTLAGVTVDDGTGKRATVWLDKEEAARAAAWLTNYAEAYPG